MTENATKDIIIVGFCPGETDDAGTGGFQWGPDTEENREWAERELNSLDHSIHNVYLAHAKVPAHLDREQTTRYIDARLEVLEPGFLTPPNSEAVDPSEPGVPGNDDDRYNEHENAPSLEDWAREYLTSLEMPDHIDEADISEWASENAPVLAQHLREAVEGYTANMDPPNSEEN